MSNSSNFFRESFRGYRKEDVNEYITEANLRFANREKDYKDKINSLSEKIASRDSELSAENKRLLSQIDAIKAENEFLLKKNGELHIKLEKAEETIKSAELKAEQEMRDFADRKENIDAISSKVGNLLVSAQLNADKLIEDAKAEAEVIKNDAESCAKATLDKANAKADEILKTVNSKVKEMSEGYLLQFGAVVSGIKEDFLRITENAKSKADSLKKDILELKADVENRVGSDKERIVNDVITK